MSVCCSFDIYLVPGLPLHFEIGGTFGLIPYFYTRKCIAAYWGSQQFWGYRPNLGVKKPFAEGKWECCTTCLEVLWSTC